MAVVTGGRNVDSTHGCLAVDTVLIDFDGVIDQNFIFGSDIEVFMTLATCGRQVDRMGSCQLHARGQNVVVSVAVVALRHVCTIVDTRATVGLIFFGSVNVAAATPFTAREELTVFGVGNQISIGVTVETLQIGVRRVREVFRISSSV